MPKTTAPLLSFDARGQIGKAQVYSSWKGRNYARRYTVPSNPQTSEQTITRNCFSFLQSVYKVAPPLFTAAWQAYVKGKVLTERNAFTKFNLPVLRGEADLTNFIFSPGALGGLPPASVTPTPGAGTLSLAITAPSVLPTDWTIQAAVGAAIRDQDPDTGVLFNIEAGEDLTAAYVVAFAGLAAADWAWGAWLRWVRPDGLIAYSPALTGISTVT